MNLVEKFKTKYSEFYFEYFQKDLIFRNISQMPIYDHSMSFQEIIDISDTYNTNTETLWNTTTKKTSRNISNSEILKHKELSIYLVSKNRIKFFKYKKHIDEKLSLDSGNSRFLAIKDLILDNIQLSSSDYLLDIGSSTGGILNGMQLYGNHNSLGIDINLDGCLSYANRFSGPKTFFKEMTLQSLIKIKVHNPFKLTLFTYQIHGDSRWLSDVSLQNNFFRWIYHNSEYFLTNSNFLTDRLCKEGYFKEISRCGEGSFHNQHPLILLKSKQIHGKN